MSGRLPLNVQDAFDIAQVLLAVKRHFQQDQIFGDRHADGMAASWSCLHEPAGAKRRWSRRAGHAPETRGDGFTDSGGHAKPFKHIRQPQNDIGQRRQFRGCIVVRPGGAAKVFPPGSHADHMPCIGSDRLTLAALRIGQQV